MSTQPIPDLAVGDRATLGWGSKADATRWWTVRAGDERFTILTRQRDFHAKGKLIYTIIDRERDVRGPCNLIGQGYDVEEEGGCDRLLADLRSGAVEVSYRNNVRIKIVDIERIGALR